jgi:enoyl-CoA hydratase/carnithine racemase
VTTTVAQLAELVLSPDAGAVLSDDPFVAVDLDDRADDGLAPGIAAAVAAHIGVLPGVFVGVCAGPAPRGPIAAALTTVVTGADLEAIEAQVRAAPIAAAVLHQLLSATERSRVPDALLAESWAYSMLLTGGEFRAWREREPLHSRSEPDGEPVLAARTADELEITLSRPAVHNAYSASMRDGLCAALAIVEADPTIERVVLRGAGPSFCSGGDLGEFGLAADAAAAHVVRTARSAALSLDRLRARGTDLVALVHGACIGAGLELAAFAGRLVASPDTVFRLPEIAMGLVPGAGGTVSIPRRIGRQRAAALALEGAPIDSARALEIGLVDEIAPAGAWR